MMTIMLMWIAGLSFLALTTMVVMQVFAFKAGRVVTMEQSDRPSIMQTKIDDLAVLFVLVCHEGSKFLSLHVLVFLHRLVSSVKMATIQVEKKFSRVINAVRGKGEPSKKGTVSFFLREIQDHKNRVKVKVSL